MEIRDSHPDDPFSASIDDPKLLAALAAVPQNEQTPWTRNLSRAAAATEEGLKLFEDLGENKGMPVLFSLGDVPRVKASPALMRKLLKAFGRMFEAQRLSASVPPLVDPFSDGSRSWKGSQLIMLCRSLCQRSASKEDPWSLETAFEQQLKNLLIMIDDSQFCAVDCLMLQATSMDILHGQDVQAYTPPQFVMTMGLQLALRFFSKHLMPKYRQEWEPILKQHADVCWNDLDWR
ncbi:hypothetical protein WJX74_007049 [Apatococcus lobatus]|uniref:Uncharacterized protein n=1 Tax=Apatococcus lobatus TaxID=904363 RepID=A0AAW1S2R7_9CHLO